METNTLIQAVGERIEGYKTECAKDGRYNETLKLLAHLTFMYDIWSDRNSSWGLSRNNKETEQVQRCLIALESALFEVLDSVTRCGFGYGAIEDDLLLERWESEKKRTEQN